MWSNLENVLTTMYIDQGFKTGDAYEMAHLFKDFHKNAKQSCKKEPYLVQVFNQRLPDSEDLLITACMMFCYIDIFVDMGVSSKVLQDYINRQPLRVRNLVLRYCR